MADDSSSTSGKESQQPVDSLTTQPAKPIQNPQPQTGSSRISLPANGVGAGLFAGNQNGRDRVPASQSSATRPQAEPPRRNTGVSRRSGGISSGATRPQAGPPRRNTGILRRSGGIISGDGSHGTNSGAGKTHLKCEQCKRPGHFKEGCYEIIGWPEGWRSRRRDSATATSGGDRRAAAHTAQVDGRTDEDERREGAGGTPQVAAYLGVRGEWAKSPSYPSPFNNNSFKSSLTNVDQGICKHTSEHASLSHEHSKQ